jgi:hypothetical protein
MLRAVALSSNEAADGICLQSSSGNLSIQE